MFNYMLIRKDSHGFFVPIMGFATSDRIPTVAAHHPRFTELFSALEHASTIETEFGLRIHDECHEDTLPTLEKTAQGHYEDCAELYKEDEDEDSDTVVCNCDDIKTNWDKDFSSSAL